MSRCTRPRRFGWRCIRDEHPYNTPCAAVPAWYNIVDKWRFRKQLR